MKKLYVSFLAAISAISFSAVLASAADLSHTVVSGDSMWKIAVKYQVGLSEIISANPHIKDPALIYPGQKLNVN